MLSATVFSAYITFESVGTYSIPEHSGTVVLFMDLR